MQDHFSVFIQLVFVAMVGSGFSSLGFSLSSIILIRQMVLKKSLQIAVKIRQACPYSTKFPLDVDSFYLKLQFNSGVSNKSTNFPANLQVQISVQQKLMSRDFLSLSENAPASDCRGGMPIPLCHPITTVSIWRETQNRTSEPGPGIGSLIIGTLSKKKRSRSHCSQQEISIQMESRLVEIQYNCLRVFLTASSCLRSLLVPR